MGFFSCEVFDDNDDSPNTSYNCTNNDCFSADGGGGQYATLDDCQSACGGGITIDEPITICAEIDVNSPIDVRVSWSTLDVSESFYLTGDNTSAVLNPNCDMQTVTGAWSLPQFEWDISVVKYHTFSTGSNSFFEELSELDFITGCSDVQVKIYGDDVLVDTHNFQLGCSEWGYTENSIGSYSLESCVVFCSPYGTSYDGVTDFSD